MLRLFYFVTPDTMPEALVYFEVTMPRALLPSETITLTFFNTLLLDVNNSVTYELNSSDAVNREFVAISSCTHCLNSCRPRNILWLVDRTNQSRHVTMPCL